MNWAKVSSICDTKVTNLFDHEIMCEDCEEEQQRLYLMLTQNHTVTLMALPYWEPPFGVPWRYHTIKRPEGELDRWEWNAVQHELSTTSTLKMKNVEKGRIWGRNEIEGGTKPVDKLFLSGELV
jgi:hypothetical protein